MCYFIAIAVPKQFDQYLQTRLSTEFYLETLSNHSILQMIQCDQVAYWVTTGACSCSLYQNPDAFDKKIARIKKKYYQPKYKKRGWTEAKMQRAIADQLANMQKINLGLRFDLKTALFDVVKQAKTLSLYVHWYSGDIGKETVPCFSSVAITVDEFVHNEKLVLEDMLIALKTE